MATGDVNDFLIRLRNYIPNEWFPDIAPILQAVLSGGATGDAFIYSLIQYGKLQTRIATATDGWLDILAYDFFGGSFLRPANMSDATFRARILPEILRRKATRPAMAQALIDLTGRAPIIVEPARPDDCGGYDVGGDGYDVAGAWGENLVAQTFIIAYRPIGAGIPNVAGYDSGAGGYDVGGSEYTSLDMVAGGVTDAQIYAEIDKVKPVGTVVWTQIRS